jgi:hypothetical protein
MYSQGSTSIAQSLMGNKLWYLGRHLASFSFAHDTIGTKVLIDVRSNHFHLFMRPRLSEFAPSGDPSRGEWPISAVGVPIRIKAVNPATPPAFPPALSLM